MKRLTITFLVLLSFLIPLMGQNSELDGYFLRKISFTGNTDFSSSQLKRVISLKPVYTRQGMKRITYRYIKSERKKIKNYYVSEGFLNCSVQDSLVIYKKNMVMSVTKECVRGKASIIFISFLKIKKSKKSRLG